MAHGVDQWPAIATVPSLPVFPLARRAALRRLTDVWKGTGIEVTEAIAPVREPSPGTVDAALPDSPELPTVFLHDATALAARLHSVGWRGLGESFMAGEWSSPDPGSVLTALMAGPSPSRRHRVVPGPAASESQRQRAVRRTLRTRSSRTRTSPEATTGIVPFELCALFTDPSFSTGSAEFADGARSRFTETAYRGRRVRRTILEPPSPPPVRQDLFPAQRRRIGSVLADANAEPSGRFLMLAAEWGEPAITAALGPDHADVVVRALSDEQARVISVRSEEADARGRIRVTQRPLRQLQGAYDAIFAIDRMESDSEEDIRALFAACADLLVPGGRAIIQCPVTTPVGMPWRTAALEFTRAYVWPNLAAPTEDDIGRALDAVPSLTLESDTVFTGHHRETVRLWDETFRARSREAAALGFDPVFRRMWRYHLGLLRACLDAGHWDSRRLVVRKNRRR